MTNQSRQELLEFLKEMKAFAKEKREEAGAMGDYDRDLCKRAERFWDGQHGAYGIVQEYVYKHIKKEG